MKQGVQGENHTNVTFLDKTSVVMQGEPTPTLKLQAVLNFGEKNFYNWMFNYEIYENSVL